MQKAKRRLQDKERAKDPVRKLYWSARWKEESKAFLRERPWCCVPDCDRPSDTVDHNEPHKGDLGLFWDQSNWRPICHRCHSRKTARQDGGFGNKIRRTKA
ncbi:HNH endonuclease [Salipiger pacificus]|nr:HNH endonuclease [Alloyangia pacifica]